jgi:mannose-6-phosphate isomerase-like protein (cupin superfamily)
MAIRRVVAANRNGRSTIISDEAEVANAFHSVPGFDPVAAWSTSPNATLTPNDRVTAGDGLVPASGGTTLFVVTFPPDSVMATENFDSNAAGVEYGQRLPGLAERFEAEHPGMHQTDTIDYDIVLDGEIWVEFDEGEVQLQRGDVLIQHGTRHAWRNRSDRPAIMIFVLVGTRTD